MKCSSFFTASIALLAGAATAAPAAPLSVREPPSGVLPGLLNGLAKVLPAPLGNGLLNGVGEVFKGGDALLNNIVDAAETTLKGRPDKAITNAIQNGLGLLSSLPKDAANIAGIGGKKPASPKE
ncbi:hypothetical protein PWT90_10645 [Aphanocladium album]|nr:hypothetical protein PWT90_10645 [Aphanocladium album]